MENIIIAVDGPAGAGKSTIAKIIAKRLNINYIDTGAMYRAVTLKCLQNNVDVKDENAVIEMAKKTSIDFRDNNIYLDSKIVNDEIRTLEVSKNVSDVAKIKEVRYLMVDLQREIGKNNAVILDGRDIGSYVFPNADYKFFLVATPEERGKRRYIELKEKGYKTFICTGRAPFYASRLFGNLVSGIISCNGRYILYEGKKLYSRAFTKEQLDYYVHKLDQGKLGAMFVSDDKALKYHLNQKQEVDLEKEYGIEHLVDSLEGDFYTFDMFYQSQEHYQTMVEIFKEDLIINDHGGMGSCDCSTIEFDKGSAIAYLLDYFHIDKDNAYAFGDGYNDQAMFREVGHGIAMGNAVDVLKEKATYITDDFDQDGILKALYHEKIL